MADLQPSQWVRGAVWAVGLGLGLFIMLFTALYSDLRSDSVERTGRLTVQVQELSQRKRLLHEKVELLAREISVIGEQSSGHANESKEWKTRIRNLEVIARDLITDSSARPDPFTGTDGQKLQQRINVLEATNAAFEILIPDLIQLKRDVRALQLEDQG